MRIGWVSPFYIKQRRGGWQGSNYHLFQALSRTHAAIEIIAPVQPAADSWAKWFSRVLTLLTGKRLVHDHSDRTMKRLSDLISATTQNLNVDLYLFFGNAGYFRHFPPKPFAYFTDSAFVPYLRFYAQDRNYSKSEYRRLQGRERAWFSRIDRIFTTSEFSRLSILETYGDVITPEKVCNVHIGPNIDYQPTVVREISKPAVLFICSDFARKGGIGPSKWWNKLESLFRTLNSTSSARNLRLIFNEILSMYTVGWIAAKPWGRKNGNRLCITVRFFCLCQRLI